ncbi:hypothetical protein IUS38_24825 [Mycobacteroides abscessus subsp. abscessus]|uniref:hypothetical protein n=1 Tax=Mycobacteroides abscessus TaxID=36809 RepID=UPI0019D2AC43|nr:hypothetical protein [Mycobacteroides abscessus subsp. abscessus]
MYWLCAVGAFIFAVWVVVEIQRRNVHDWWRYALYIIALVVTAASLSGVLHSQTQRIGIGCAVLVLSWRAFAGRAKALRQQGGEVL